MGFREYFRKAIDTVSGRRTGTSTSGSREAKPNAPAHAEHARKAATHGHTSEPTPLRGPDGRAISGVRERAAPSAEARASQLEALQSDELQQIAEETLRDLRRIAPTLKPNDRLILEGMEKEYASLFKNNIEHAKRHQKDIEETRHKLEAAKQKANTLSTDLAHMQRSLTAQERHEDTQRLTELAGRYQIQLPPTEASLWTTAQKQWVIKSLQAKHAQDKRPNLKTRLDILKLAKRIEEESSLEGSVHKTQKRIEMDEHSIAALSKSLAMHRKSLKETHTFLADFVREVTGFHRLHTKPDAKREAA